MEVSLFTYSIRMESDGFVTVLLGTDIQPEARTVPVTSDGVANRKTYYTVEVIDIWGTKHVFDLRPNVITNKPLWTNDSKGASQCVADIGPIIRNSAPGSGVVTPVNSIEFDAGGDLQLVGDVPSPGNNQVYGTDGTGARVWKPDPTASLDVTSNPGYITIPDGLGVGVDGYVPILDTPL